MGGASRNDRKRRQEESDRRLAAAGIRPQAKGAPDRTPLIVVGAVVVVAVVVGLAVWFVNRPSAEPVTPAYASEVAGAVIAAGTGPVVIDVYEDYLCPQCERFEERYGDEFTAALNRNEITVRYHAVAILDPLTNPEGYSTRAANAAVCSVPAGIFPAYHGWLFDSQPAEGSAGLTDEELIKAGTELGATGNFAGCVMGGTNSPAIAIETGTVAADPSLRGERGFGTPTVAVDGTKIDLNRTSWLQDTIAAG